MKLLTNKVQYHCCATANCDVLTALWKPETMVPRLLDIMMTRVSQLQNSVTLALQEINIQLNGRKIQERFLGRHRP